MTTPSFITRLNWRLILLNLAACWCFAYAFNLFGYLRDLGAVRAYARYWPDTDRIIKTVGNLRIAYLLLWTASGTLIGELVAFIISLILSIKKRWFWLNSFIAFLMLCLLIRFKLDGWRWLKFIFLKPGDLFGYPSAGYFIANGVVLLLLGLLCLFLPAAIRFIEAGRRPTKLREIEDLSLNNPA